MITRHERGHVTWIDIESPAADELKLVMDEFHIDPRIEQEIVSPTAYPLHIAFPNYRYLVLHFPTADPLGGARNQEIDFIVGKHFILTVRYEVIDSIRNLHKVFEAEELLGLPRAEQEAPNLLERMLRRLYGAICEEVDGAAHSLERIERDIFSGKERETVKRISEVGRVLLRFDTVLSRHKEPLSLFLSGLCQPSLFGKEFSEHAAHIEAERDHAAGLVSSFRAAAIELRDTNDSLLSASQNEVMKTLTVVTFIMFPLSLLAALFQMNVQGAPLTDQPNAFWIVLGIMALISGLLAIFVVRKKWL